MSSNEYAAIKLLDWEYRNMDDVINDSSAKAQAILLPYLQSGLLHKWAVLDMVLGSADRHGNNIMVKDGDVKLIDHGSTMANDYFDPSKDKYTFVPFYLRIWNHTATTLGNKAFKKLNFEQKLKVMPRVGSQVANELKSWLDSLNSAELQAILTKYGINPEPAMQRLEKLKVLAGQEPVDSAINRMWIEL